MLRKMLLSGVVGVALAGLGGCSYDDHDDYRDHHRYGYSEDYNKRVGDRNTRITDRVDDGRINGSARSYEERKASRAADEGYPDAARREAELRRERLNNDW